MHVVLQPTSGCNLNCRYCYLPLRNKQNLMDPAVAEAVALSLVPVPHKVGVLWHGGEPLFTGLSHFRLLCAPFRKLRTDGKVSHSLQTNATLITREWCDFLISESFRIGISVDGPPEMNRERVGWSGGECFSATMRGIELLKKHGIRFGVIAVVNPYNVTDPDGFYQFFNELGCDSLSINVEEREGLNKGATDIDGRTVRSFWEELFRAWKCKPTLRIREFDHALGWMRAIVDESLPSLPATRDFWPTVSYSGEVAVLSPELLSAAEPEQFIIGNVLSEPLTSIVERAPEVSYVKEFRLGLRDCRERCAYYSYCGGGQASNKFFELGSVRGTETAHCRNTRQYVIDAVVAAFLSEDAASIQEERSCA